jgi:hypothetical protein
MLKQAQRDGILKGLKITSSEFLSHLLFVDDVILFGAGSLQEYVALKKYWMNYVLLLECK